MIRYRPFAILLHLLVVYQFLRLAGDLARHFRVPSAEIAMLLARLIFVNGFYVLPHQAGINAQVFELWKNQPDSLCALFLILAVRRYLSASQPSVENTRQEKAAVLRTNNPGRSLGFASGRRLSFLAGCFQHPEG